jgi:hypothetical protein
MHDQDVCDIRRRALDAGIPLIGESPAFLSLLRSIESVVRHGDAREPPGSKSTQSLLAACQPLLPPQNFLAHLCRTEKAFNGTLQAIPV